MKTFIVVVGIVALLAVGCDKEADACGGVEAQSAVVCQGVCHAPARAVVRSRAVVVTRQAPAVVVHAAPVVCATVEAPVVEACAPAASECCETYAAPVAEAYASGTGSAHASVRSRRVFFDGRIRGAMQTLCAPLSCRTVSRARARSH